MQEHSKAERPQALEGIRVLDLSRFIAGPFCAMQLGDLGAEVVKVERRQKGEESRDIEPKIAGESLYVIVHNRNKRGLAIDYRHPGAPDVLRRLVRNVDVLVENFRPGTMEAMGLSWEELHRLNPRLIMTRISGFGSDGPFARRPCFDVISQAMSGLMDQTGFSDGPPTQAGTFMVDYTTGLYAAIGTLAAVQAREKTGEGQLVEANLLDSAVSFLLTSIPEYLLLGRESSRRGPRDRYTAPASNFRCADDHWVHLSAGNDALFARFVKGAQLESLLDDRRFSSQSARLDNVDALEAIVTGWTMMHPADRVVEIMETVGVPCAKVATIADVVDNPQLRHRGQIINLNHKVAGEVPMQGPAIRLSQTPVAVRRPSPSIGEHTDEVLAEWGDYDATEIKALRAGGVL